jgi:hypothetical protein
MDYLLAALEALAATVAFVLASVALLAAQRYGENRYAFIGIGLVVLGVVSIGGIINLLAAGTIPGAGLGYFTAALLLIAELLLYLSMVAKRTMPGRSADG